MWLLNESQLEDEDLRAQGVSAKTKAAERCVSRLRFEICVSRDTVTMASRLTLL